VLKNLFSFVKDLYFPAQLLKYGAVRSILSKIPRRIDKWESNLIKVNNKVILLLPLCGSSTIIEILRINGVVFSGVSDVYSYNGRIDAVLRRSDIDRVKSGYVKKVLNPDKIGKAILFSQLEVPYDISYDEFVDLIYSRNADPSFHIEKNDKHFVLWQNVDKYILKNKKIIEFWLEDSGVKKMCDFIGVDYIDIRKHTSDSMRLKYHG